MHASGFLPQGLYFVFRVGLCLGYDSRVLSTWEYFLLAFSFVVFNGAYKWQQDRLLLGVSSSTATDLYIVGLVAFVLGGAHPWGWSLWLAVPLYCIYLITNRILKWIFTPDAPDEDTPEALAFKKKQEKLERKMKSGRYVAIQK